jgi:hypothetical protein
MISPQWFSLLRRCSVPSYLSRQCAFLSLTVSGRITFTLLQVAKYCIFILFYRFDDEDTRGGPGGRWQGDRFAAMRSLFWPCPLCASVYFFKIPSFIFIY